MKVIVCGSRDWEDWRTVWQTLDGVYINFEIGYASTHLGPFELIHGDARGADKAARRWAESSPLHSYNERPDDMEFIHTPVPANWTRYRNAAGPIRNREMLKMEPDLVLAFKNDFDWTFSEGGTEDMVKIAIDSGVKYRVISTGN